MALVASYHLRLRFHTWWRLAYLYSYSAQGVYTRILSHGYENIQYRPCFTYEKIMLYVRIKINNSPISYEISLFRSYAFIKYS